MAVIEREVMQPELEFVCAEKCGIDFYYLEQSLHRTPNKMPPRIQEIIDGITGTKDRIILGYGLCSNGLVGVKSRLEDLIVPRCHDLRIHCLLWQANCRVGNERRTETLQPHRFN